MDLVEKMREHVAEVQFRLSAAKRSEASTSQFLVLPFFELLGYNVHNPNDVEPEFTADIGIQREKVDFALKQDGQPVVLVEVKYAGTNLDNQHAAQLRRYFSTKLDVRFGILTNGLEFRFFSDLDLPNVMDDQPFMTLDMLNLDETLLDTLRLFAKTAFERDAAVEAARQAKDRQRVRQVLHAEFDPLSHQTLNYLTSIIQSEEIDESRRTELTRLVNQEWQTFLSSLSPATEPILVDSNEIAAEKTYVEIPDLDGSVEIPIYATWRGHEFTTKLSLWGRIANVGKIVFWDGEWMTPSQAGKQSRITVEPNATGHVNGMEYWKLRDPEDGRLRPINDFHYDKDLLPRVLSNATP